MTANAQARYSAGAMIFHWVIAVAVIVNWRIVEAAEHLSGPDKGALMDNHKALGITILVLSIGRLLWRWTHPVAPLPATLAKWERVLARFVHLAFYVLLIGLPLGGWLAGSYVERGVDLFGIATLPPLPVGMNDAAALAEPDHSASGAIIAAISQKPRPVIIVVSPRLTPR